MFPIMIIILFLSHGNFDANVSHHFIDLLV